MNDEAEIPLDDDRDAADELEAGALDPDELESEPDWWDEGSDDETDDADGG